LDLALMAALVAAISLSAAATRNYIFSSAA
jgi:hypothetical protein